jgi:hypothetical protein
MKHTTLRFRSTALVAPVILLSLLACKKGKEQASADAAPQASSGAASGDLRGEPDAVCTMEEPKVWGKWANPRTGITARQLEGRLLVGVALGNRPHVLSFDVKGNGQLTKVALPSGSELAKTIAKNEGSRDLQRVTPIVGSDGQLAAYADYRDKYENKRRRIACELTSNAKLVLGFDDTPLLDRKKEEKPDAGAPVAGAHRLNPKLAAAVSRRLKRPAVAVAAPAAPEADAGAAPAPASPEPTTTEKKKPVREIRDCRTFVDQDGSMWAVGSELYGQPQSDDSVKWSMRFFVAPDAGGGYFVLTSTALPKEPKTLYTFEAPTVGQLPGGGFVLATRYQGALMTFVLSSGHRPTGRNKTYRGGWPTMAEFEPDDSGLLLLTSLKTGNDSYALKYGHATATGLPGALSGIGVDGADDASEPTLAVVGSQRWLAYHAGKRRGGALTLVPVDGSLKGVGKSQEVAGSVSNSAIFPLSDGKLLAVYLQSTSAGDDLVSRVMSCSVKS